MLDLSVMLDTRDTKLKGNISTYFKEVVLGEHFCMLKGEYEFTSRQGRKRGT